MSSLLRYKGIIMPSATLMGSCEKIAAPNLSSTTQFDYRSLTVHEADSLALIYLTAYPPGIAAANLDGARTEILESFAGDFGKLLTEASLGAYHGGELIGAILVVERSPWDPNLDCPFVIDVFVSPRCQGQGAGRALLAKSAQACLNAGHRQLALRVGDGTSVAANRIYASAGMVEIDPKNPPSFDPQDESADIDIRSNSLGYFNQ